MKSQCQLCVIYLRSLWMSSMATATWPIYECHFSPSSPQIFTHIQSWKCHHLVLNLHCTLCICFVASIACSIEGEITFTDGKDICTVPLLEPKRWHQSKQFSWSAPSVYINLPRTFYPTAPSSWKANYSSYKRILCVSVYILLEGERGCRESEKKYVFGCLSHERLYDFIYVP